MGRGAIGWLATPSLEEQKVIEKLNKNVNIMEEIKANTLDSYSTTVPHHNFYFVTLLDIIIFWCNNV